MFPGACTKNSRISLKGKYSVKLLEQFSSYLFLIKLGIPIHMTSHNFQGKWFELIFSEFPVERNLKFL